MQPVLSFTYALYGDIQRRPIVACEAFACDSEIYSINETFLDLLGVKDREICCPPDDEPYIQLPTAATRSS